MNPWTNNLPPFKGRKSTPLGRGATVNLASSDYSGPADGDFVRYVDQLLSNADDQRRAQARAPAAAHDARAASRQPAESRERTRAQAQEAVSKPVLKAGFKLVPFVLWLLVVTAMFFWQGAAIWLVGLLVVGGVVFNAVRKGLVGKKR
ncbi:hypothetical protein [Pantoea sp. 18069]|uniref:hypothetical protein n=1 Tax=Pantoea sp. 18069 TaxID=2681415 RepID=UPI00135C923C|nr:hypothetical protein [Pantoea sp. 18069]